jgi:hypothetical protein
MALNATANGGIEFASSSVKLQTMDRILPYGFLTVND